MSSEEDRVGRLFDYLVEHPERVTVEQIMAGLGWRMSVIKQTIRALRLSLSDDTINLVCDPDPAEPQGRWLYGLVGTSEAARAWQANRLLDTESRLETQYAVALSLVAGVDGRTRDGRKARLIKKALGRLIEDLHDLNTEELV